MTDKQFNDLIVRYAIHLAEESIGVKDKSERLSDKEFELVESWRISKPEVNEYIHFLYSNYLEVYREIDAAGFADMIFLPQQPAGQPAVQARQAQRRWAFSENRFPAIVFATAVLLFFSLQLVIDFTQLPYEPVFADSLDITLPIARGTTTSITQGKILFNEDKLNEAIEQFYFARQQFSAEGGQTEKMFSAYYLGLTYLKQSRNTTFGLFTHFESTALDSSLKYLDLSLDELQPDSPFKNEIQFYLGLGRTIRFDLRSDNSDFILAQKYLNSVIATQTDKSGFARQILNCLIELEI